MQHSGGAALSCRNVKHAYGDRVAVAIGIPLAVLVGWAIVLSTIVAARLRRVAG